VTSVRFANRGAVGINTELQLDGHDVRNHVSGLTLSAQIGEPVRITLDVPVHKVTEYEGDAAVSFNPELEEILISLGWTPPAQ
jgi:hypothetical protein